jgi:hypothetical protein
MFRVLVGSVRPLGALAQINERAGIGARVSGAGPFSRSRNTAVPSRLDDSRRVRACPSVSPADLFLPEMPPRHPGWGTLANESVGALWFENNRVSGDRPFSRPRNTAVLPADLFLPEKTPPPPGVGYPCLRFRGGTMV